MMVRVLFVVVTAAFAVCAVWLSPWALLVAAPLLSWSVHSAFHDAVHATGNDTLSAVVGLVSTPIMGLPFDGYRLHHRNHHQTDNGPEDLSKTWTMTNNGPVPRNPVWYALSWPLALYRARTWVRRATSTGLIDGWIRSRIRVQQLCLVLVLIGLGWWSIAGLGWYLTYVYLGWSLVSLHNYGQHPPRPGAVISLHRGWYNRLTGNNGLHAEHHAQPGLPAKHLQADPHAAVTRWPHPLRALVPNTWI